LPQPHDFVYHLEYYDVKRPAAPAARAPPATATFDASRADPGMLHQPVQKRKRKRDHFETLEIA
jgi:hypothetical protein